MPKSLVRLTTCILLFVPLATIISMVANAAVTTSIIRGTVTAGDGPVSGALVRLFSPDYKIPIDATMTDASGNYELIGDLPGNYTITVKHDSYKDQTLNINVVQQITTAVNFLLIEAYGCVEGSITITNSRDKSKTAICLIDRYSNIYSVTQADEQGHYAFSRIPSGNYQIDFLHQGFPERKIPVSVVADKTSTLNYSLTDSWYGLYGSSKPFDPSKGYVHLRGSDENNYRPETRSLCETIAPAYGTELRIR